MEISLKYLQTVLFRYICYYFEVLFLENKFRISNKVSLFLILSFITNIKVLKNLFQKPQKSSFLMNFVLCEFGNRLNGVYFPRQDSFKEIKLISF